MHTLSAAQKRDICTRGGVVIRNVLPRDLATSLLSSTRQYISYNASQVRAFPPSNPSVYELYWSPSQVAARSHPHVLNTQRFLQSLWNSSDSSSSSSALSTQHTLTYADRLRIRPPGDSGFSLGPHVDGGSVERWEDPTYRAVYRNIFSGNWEDYDPFDYAYRADANMDLYNSPGGCGMFRMFQGWLSLSTTAPGEGSLKINPMLKEAMAYVLLRPFFRENDGKLYTQAEMMSDLPGAVQGASQEINDLLHPHLHLSSSKSSSMVSIPTVNPGDYVAWHCDTIHSVDPRHTGKQDSAVLYIPAVPLCKMNALYLKRQREAAKVLSVPPDFPGAEVKGVGEEGFAGRLEDWTRVGEEGRRAMGMGERKWEVTENMGVGERTAVEEANRILFA